MNRNYFLYCIFGISACLVTGAVSILRGSKADENKFTYSISEQVVGHGHDCGGGIIGDYHILTAAHCLINHDGKFDGVHLQILAGTQNLHKTHSPAVKIDVVKAYVPTEYTPTHDNPTGDIAVLKLKHALPRHLDRLSLPNSRNDHHANEVAKISGFGWTNIRTDGPNKEIGINKDGHLHYADAVVIPNAECQAEYPKATISDRELCARVKQHREDRPRGACVGDSGSPLVHDNTVIGVLSVTPHGCSEQKQAGLYTRVAHYLQFIHDAINDRDNHNIRFKDLPH